MTVAFRDAYEMVSGNTKALLAHRVMTIPKYHGISKREGRGRERRGGERRGGERRGERGKKELKRRLMENRYL